MYSTVQKKLAESIFMNFDKYIVENHLVYLLTQGSSTWTQSMNFTGIYKTRKWCVYEHRWSSCSLPIVTSTSHALRITLSFINFVATLFHNLFTDYCIFRLIVAFEVPIFSNDKWWWLRTMVKYVYTITYCCCDCPIYLQNLFRFIKQVEILQCSTIGKNEPILSS